MARSIMIQGTMSGAGKSLIAAALCRIFAQDGLKAVPFKSQNMALNSYVTADGMEMGRAQVMQAEAAMREPDIRMNPILLKPTSDVGSQVILNGRPIGNMRAKEYFARKREFIPDIMKAYNSLSAENDIIVIEGAGSPAEINLKKNDIVNMGMARLAKAPVLLVGDIDRGGVFAQLYGTTELLEKAEKAMIKGLIINKFRGDVSILQSGLDTLSSLTGKRILGVVPYTDADIDDEDSLSERICSTSRGDGVDVAVIRLPHISNFTDFTPFECAEGVSLRYVRTAHELGSPDLIIIPGTKNTIGDLMWLRENGLEALICRKAEGGCAVIGICGGFQMLGRYVRDPYGSESGGEVRGIGLLDVSTTFSKEKTTRRVNGNICGAQGIFSELNGIGFKGYEIHMGRTESSCAYFSQLSEDNGEKSPDGAARDNIWGTYVHGIFDTAEITSHIAEALAKRRGIDIKSVRAFDMDKYKQTQYDKLAEAVRGGIDMDAVYRIVEEGIR